MGALYQIIAGLSAAFLVGTASHATAQTPVATTTTLVSSVPEPISPGTAVVLTATVLKAGNAIVSPGQVTFCDADAERCSGVSVIGRGELNSSTGSAILRFVPALGAHNYKAVFVGTKANASSSSNVAAITVSGPPAPTTTTLTASGSPANYTLTASVAATGRFSPLIGNIPFVDTTNNNNMLGTVPLGSSTLTLNFIDAPNSPLGAGDGTNLVAVGDFNGDGFSDIVTANYFGSSVNVFLGDGAGHFTETPQSPIAVDRGPFSVVVGDFANDGIADLVTANFDSGTLDIFRGDGNGGFTFFGTLTTPSPSAIAVADFDRDGNLDIAVTNFIANTVTIFLGDGTDHFTQRGSPIPIGRSASTVPIGANPNDIAVGDINGDGIADIVTPDRQDNAISILLGDGNGGFTVSSVPVGTNPRSVVIQDLNGDGIADIAVANKDDASLAGSITILLGDGRGGFTPSTVGSDLTPIYIASADFNGDGIPDLATANGPSNTVSILLGDGHGGFSISPPITDNGAPSHIVAGAFSQNGIVDLAIANFDTDNIRILLDQPQQAASAVLSDVLIPGTGIHSVTASFPGDTNYASSPSGSVELTATKLTTSLTVAVSPPTSSYGQQVALMATLTIPVTPATPSTDGELVTFLNGVTVLGTGTLHGGVATLLTTTLPAGVLSLSVEYTGDSFLLSSTSPSVSYTVTKAVPVISWPSPLPISYGVALGSAQLNATSSVPGSFVYTPSPGAVLNAGTQTLTTTFTPTDTVNYSGASASVTLTVTKAVPVISWPSSPPISYGVALSAIQLNATTSVAGKLIYTPPAGTVLNAGTQTLRTTFTPTDAVNYTVASATVLLSVVKAVPIATLTANSSTVDAGSPLTLTAQIAPPVNGTTLTGSVTFLDGAMVIGSSIVVGNAAALTVTNLSGGSHNITAAYGGDANFTTTSSPGITVLVADFAVTVKTPGSQPIPPGGVATYIISVASVGATFDNPVSLSASNLPPGATYTFSPSSVVPGPNGASSTFTINIPLQSSGIKSPGHSLPLFALLFLPLALFKPSNGRYRRVVFSVLLSLAIVGALVGCGTGGYFNHPETTYDVMVTGTSGTLSRSGTVPLTVQ